MKALERAMAALAVLLAVGLAAACAGFYFYQKSHIRIGGELYNIYEETLDLRGRNTTAEKFETLQQALPGTNILWDVPFQDTTYSSDTQEITITSLTEEDVAQLDYLPRLRYVNATQCRDIKALKLLQERRPDCQVDYQLLLAGKPLDETMTAVTLNAGEGTAQELWTALEVCKDLCSVELHDPSIPAADLYAMQEQYPDVSITWDKVFMGRTYTTEIRQIDISNTRPESLQYVEETAAYFPHLNKLLMAECGFLYEDLAQYRDRVRDQYKVVWGVHVGEAYVLTDSLGFIPSDQNALVLDEDTYNLRYCEDLIAVDIGHLNISCLEWTVGTPHLKYLIMGDCNVQNEDIKNLARLKELEWLELFNTGVTDISPLAECTSLKDILLSKTYPDVEPLGRMPWLEHLWFLRSGIDGEDIMYIREHCPNVVMQVGDSKDAHSHGWRDLPRYFEMRDALGMWYMKG